MYVIIKIVCYFQFFTKNRPQKHQKHAILHTLQANGGVRAPPRPPPPPWLRYCIRCLFFDCICKKEDTQVQRKQF